MPKFINIAHPRDPIPSLINLDHVLRIRPGSAISAATGREDMCTIFFVTREKGSYEDGQTYNEPHWIEVHLSVKEIVRRIHKECFSV